MDNDIPKERKDQFMKGAKMNPLKRREETSLQLRKDKLHESMMQRRFASLPSKLTGNNKYEIIPSDLNLDEDILNSFFSSPDKLDMSFRMILDKDEKLRMFGIRQLRNFTETLGKSTKVEEMIPPKNCEDIVSIMTGGENNLNMIFESSWVLINLTNSSTFYVRYLAKSQTIDSMFNLMVKCSEYEILTHVLWIMSNIIGESADFYKAVLTTCDLPGLVTSWLQNDASLPTYFRTVCLWSIGNFFIYDPCEALLDLIVPLVPTIAKHLQSNLNQDLFSEALFALKRIISQVPDYKPLCITLASIDIIKVLVGYVNTKTNQDDLIQIYTILGNLTWKDDKIVYDLYENDFFEKTEEILSQSLLAVQQDENYYNKNKNFFAKIFWCLSNCAASQNEKLQEVVIRDTKIPKYLLEIFPYIKSRQVYKEILYVFSNATDTTSTKLKTELVRIMIPELFCSILVDNHDNDIVLACLLGIRSFLEYGSRIMKDRNIIKEELEKIGTVQIIENLQNSKVEKIADISGKIIEKFFSNAEYVSGDN